MSTNLLQYFFPSSKQDSTTNPSSDTCINLEYKEFLPEVYDTWTYIHELSNETTRFREIYDMYKYERSDDQQQTYFNQLKTVDDSIYKLSFTIHQRIQYLEKLVRPTFDEFHPNEKTTYIPASIRIAQNQLHSLKLSFKRIITKHNTDSIDYQNDLTQSIERTRTKINSPSAFEKIKNLFQIDDQQIDEKSMNIRQEQIQIQEQDLSEQEKQIFDLETRLESIRILKDRVRRMNEMTMALYISVQEQNDLTDNIWLNTNAGSDYIAQSVEEFRLVKNVKQSKINLWIKLIAITCCFLLILIFILVLIIILGQK